MKLWWRRGSHKYYSWGYDTMKRKQVNKMQKIECGCFFCRTFLCQMFYAELWDQDSCWIVDSIQLLMAAFSTLMAQGDELGYCDRSVLLKWACSLQNAWIHKLPLYHKNPSHSQPIKEWTVSKYKFRRHYVNYAKAKFNYRINPPCGNLLQHI